MPPKRVQRTLALITVADQCGGDVAQDRRGT